jgi:hypothetical protein
MIDSRFELRNKEQGMKIRLSGDFIRVGRAEDNTIVLADPSISRYHVNLYPQGSVLVVEDAGSKTGFFVNGIAQRGTVTLKSGDVLKIGNQSFSLFVASGAMADDGAGASFSGIPTSQSSEGSGDDAKRRRLIIYGAAALFLVAALVSQQDTPAKVPLAGEDTLSADKVTKAIEANISEAELHRHKARGEIEAEGKFQEGMRDYNNGNYVRSIQRFEEALTQNPSMSSAADYLQFSQARLKTQISDLMQDGQRSFALLQYSRAKAQFAQVLSIMSEQIPGYWQQVSQKSLGQPENARRPAQEETLLDIPCERTKDAATCKLAVELIKQARNALGEEDTIR